MISFHKWGKTNDDAGDNRTSRSSRALAALLVFVLVAAACSSDESASDASSDATDAPAETSDDNANEGSDEPDEGADEEPVGEATGEPIKIMATGTIESPAFSIPSTPIGAQIAIDEVNAEGGINGRPLELIVCNDELDPNVAAGCIQQGIDEGVVSLVSGLSVFEPLVFPLLNEAGIPWIGPATSNDFSTSILFPLANDGATAFSAIGYAAVESGCANPAVFFSAQGTPANGEAISAGIEVAGGTVAIVLQGNGPDFGPLVESAIAEGAECVASGVSPPETAGLVAAIAGRLPLITLDGPLPAPLAASLGEAVEGTLVVGGYRLPAAGDANVLALLEKSEAEYPGISVDNAWTHGYVGVHLLTEVLREADEVSAAALFEGLSSVTNFDTGFGPILDFSTPNASPGYERVFNTEMLLWRIEGGQYTLVEGVSYDMQPAIDLLGGL